MAGAPQPLQPQPLQQGLLEGLHDYGWVEGRDFTMERRYANLDQSALRVFATELVSLRVDVIVATNSATAFAAKEATKNVPIVVVAAHDATGTGLVASLSRPGGNVTGEDSYAPALDAKRLEYAKQVIPALARVGVLYNPAAPAARQHLDVLAGAAGTLGVTVQPLELTQAAELDGAFRALANKRPDVLIVVTDTLTYTNRERILVLAAQQRLAVISEFREFAEGGGLLAYGPTLREMYRRAGYFVDKVLNGTKPADLPMEQPTKFELVVNRQTAKTLGLTIPQSLLLRADDVIQ